VFGFRVEDAKRARAQLDRLEKLLGGLAEQVPQMKGRVKTTRVGGASFLTVAVDGKMVPWEQVPLDKVEKKQGEFDDLVKKLQTLKLTVALGVRDDYLLFSMGQSTAPLAALGGGKALADLPELRPLAKHAGERLTSIGYVSKKFAEAAQFTKADLDKLLETAREHLGEAGLAQEGG